MKKVFVIALLAIGLTSFAQEGKKKNRPEQNIEMRINKISQELALNEDQKKQLGALMNDFETFKSDKKEKLDNKKPNKRKLKEFSERMKNILTPEQFEKWQGLKKDRLGKKENEAEE